MKSIFIAIKKVLAVTVLAGVFLSIGIVSDENFESTKLTPGDKLIIELFKE